MPVPTSITFHNERLAVDSNFRVATRGHSDARLQAAIARFMKRLEGRTVLTLNHTLAPDDQTTPLIIQTQGPGKDIPGLGEDESYRIDITRRQASSARQLSSAPSAVSKLCCNYSTPIAMDTSCPACRSTIDPAFHGAD